MTGIIFDIKRFAIHEGPGLRTTVFLKGCSLHCSWCHNPESMEIDPCVVNKTLKLNGQTFTNEETIGYEISTDRLYAELAKERVFMDESGGGVTFSGGEPLVQYDFLKEMLMICKQNGMHTTVDTSLYAPWDKIEALLAFTDLWLVDLKLMNSASHEQYTGVSNELILNNIKMLAETETDFIIRIPMIPHATDSRENIAQSISFLHTLNGSISEVHLLPFHNTANGKYERTGKVNLFGHLKSMQKDELQEVAEQYENEGFRVRIGG
jgi:pyruvate formate lyase activating enzyme